MNGRRAAIGLSLLCALAFSAFAAPSAMAVEGTTAFTCVNGGGAKDYADAHCATKQVGGAFGHVDIAEGVATEVEGSNAETKNSTTEATQAKFTGKVAGVGGVEITATTVASTGSLTNGVGPPMKVKGTAQIKYKGLTVVGLAGCGIVGGEIVAEANAETQVEGGERWVTFQGKGANAAFAQFQFENIAACKGFKGLQIQVRGQAGARPNGATLEFKETETKNTLQIGKEPAGSSRYTGIETVKMKGGGNPIFLAVEGTTAFTCVNGGGAKDYADVHCATEQAGGNFGHVEIAEGIATAVEGTNAETKNSTTEATQALLVGKVAGVGGVEITATTVASNGVLTNEKGPPTRAEGTVEITYQGLTVVGLAGCGIVGGEITAEAIGETQIEGGERWVTFTGKGANETFAVFEFENVAACKGFKGLTVTVKGKAGARPNGATLEFGEKEPKNTLQIGKEPAGSSRYTGIETVSMESKENPITLTTQVS